MAMSDGTPVDAVAGEERWREMPDGVAVLGEEDLRQLRGLLAADPRSAVEKVGLRSAEELDAVAVHGAPAALVERVRAALALLRHGEERREPLDYREAFAPPPVTLKLPEEPGKCIVRVRMERGSVVSAEIVGERFPGTAPGERRSEYLARRAAGK